MYCRKCGKFIDYDGDVCKECAREAEVFEEDTAVKETEENQESTYVFIETPQSASSQSSSYQPNTNKKLGFSTALMSLIFGAVATGFASFASTFLAVGLDFVLDAMVIEGVLSEFLMFTYIGIGLLVVGFGFAIPAVINGIKGIKIYRGAVLSGGTKPVVTLVLSIIGLVMAVSAVLNALTFFLDLSTIVATFPELL